MNRIFLVLATFSNLGLAATFLLGWSIGDPSVPESATLLTVHLLVALGALLVALLVHAVVLTYFMGTGRWIEETATAYRLGGEAREENIRLKYRTLPAMVGCLVLLIVTGAFGAASDPASSAQMASAGTIHLVLATTTLLANLLVSVIEYGAIERNGRLVSEVVEKVHAMRAERGLVNVG